MRKLRLFRGEAILKIELENVGCGSRSTRLQRLCSLIYASLLQCLNKGLRIATSVIGKNWPLNESDAAARPICLWQWVVNISIWLGWQCLIHWIISHFLAIAGSLYMWPFICFLCHCSCFHSIGNHYHVKSPHVSFLLPFYTLTFHYADAPLSSLAPSSYYWSWDILILRSWDILILKGLGLDQLHSFHPPTFFFASMNNHNHKIKRWCILLSFPE